MILRIGPNKTGLRTKKGFTLIEILTAVAILSAGIIGVIRSYMVLMNAAEVSYFTVQASYLLKTEMARIEKEAIDNCGISAGTKSGNFEAPYSNFSWHAELAELKVSKASEGAKGDGSSAKSAQAAADEQAVEVLLTKVHLTAMKGSLYASGQKLSLWTYLENYLE
ncbi:MAG: prepilin-type N-terminal cleavage/methylation domain-containing protein [Candidatus Omnitrophica bacterium]|nr:prepilin-type N-terminal cleavage/methylation domain-containing protein [Candidatus Omnitrophota bacterium]